MLNLVMFDEGGFRYSCFQFSNASWSWYFCSRCSIIELTIESFASCGSSLLRYKDWCRCLNELSLNETGCFYWE